MRRTQAEQTADGDYETISYHTFGAVDYDRFMSWRAGSGSIAVGVRKVTPQRTNADNEDELLPKGWSVVVIDTEFKLVRK
jgi:hypothetical protein